MLSGNICIGKKLHAAMRSMRTVVFWGLIATVGVIGLFLIAEECSSRALTLKRAKSGMWWTQSQPISITCRESLVET